MLSEQSIVQTGLGNLQAQTTLIISEHQEAKQSRAELHRKVENTNDRLSDTTSQVALMRHELARIAPMVDAHEKIHLQDAGQRKGRIEMGKLAYGLLTALAAVVAFLLHEALEFITTRWGR